MKKILFLIPNLMYGGAERVLVNLVNNLDKNKYDITVMTLFDVGVNKEFLNSEIRYKYIFKKQFRGNSHILKLFSSEFLYKLFIKDKYDILVSYLEGTTARIIAGNKDSDCKKICWIHIELNDEKKISNGFRNLKEAKDVYSKYDKLIAVSQTVKDIFLENIGSSNLNMDVIYNTNETNQIKEKSLEEIYDLKLDKNIINICSVAKIIPAKGFDRLVKVHKRLIDEGLMHHIYLLGVGDEKENIEKFLKLNNLEDTFTFLGFKKNPYKYIKACDLYICSSRREGFSTAVTESLIIGTPVVSTLCSGAKELLGENNEYGIVVENSEEGIYKGLKQVLTNKELINYYKEKSIERSKKFSKESTVKSVEDLLDSL